MTAVGGVPVGRRNLFSERRRALLGVAGVGMALIMVLALDGIVAGVMRQVTRYIDSSDADLFVSQRGVRTMHMSSSSIPLDGSEEIRGLQGVRWADPILYDSGALLAADARELTYLIGYVPGRRGGAATLAKGEEPRSGEIVLDEPAARQAAAAYLAGEGGLSYTVQVSASRVEVAVSRQARTSFLRIVGIRGVEISAVASASPRHAVVAATRSSTLRSRRKTSIELGCDDSARTALMTSSSVAVGARPAWLLTRSESSTTTTRSNAEGRPSLSSLRARRA